MMSPGQQCYEAYMYSLYSAPRNVVFHPDLEWNSLDERKRMSWDHVARVKIANTPKETNRP